MFIKLQKHVQSYVIWPNSPSTNHTQLLITTADYGESQLPESAQKVNSLTAAMYNDFTQQALRCSVLGTEEPSETDAHNSKFKVYGIYIETGHS